MCNNIEKYIDTFKEYLQIQKLEVGGQIFSHAQLQEKFQDDHMKNLVEIKQLEKIVNDAIGVFVVNPTKVAARLHESMFHLDYKMHQLTDMSMDLEVKVEGLCSMKCTKTNDRMKQWDDLLLNKY